MRKKKWLYGKFIRTCRIIDRENKKNYRNFEIRKSKKAERDKTQIQ